jgi:hypothetical protein
MSTSKKTTTRKKQTSTEKPSAMSESASGWTVASQDGKSLLRSGWRYLWARGEKPAAWVPVEKATFDIREKDTVVCYPQKGQAEAAAQQVGGVVLLANLSMSKQRDSEDARERALEEVKRQLAGGENS